ncbi:MAG: aminopeptidase [Candidatus Marinimicrobia bacterium]|nr:aminopeptidase [Candidatus Neomarinimicrobiota bacterium]
MFDPREKKLAELLVNYSCDVQKGENVLIEAFDIPETFVKQLIRAIRQREGNPFVSLKNNSIQRELFLNGTDEQVTFSGEYEAYRMKNMQAYIGVRGSQNITELSDVPADDMKRYQTLWSQPVHSRIRVPDTKWVVLRWPTPSMAQQAGMSTEEFEEFYFDVCTLDYPKMALAQKTLMALEAKTDKVHIKGPGETDLRFSVKDIPVIQSCGLRNIPDGEVFTAPVRDSANGVIEYNTPTLYQGTVFDRIKLTFKDGKIIKVDGDDVERLEEIFNTDEGARYVGEFAIGMNPYINRPMKDILFDEKIAGSIHFTPGNSYDNAFNGNRSAIHWDLVLRQTPECGGGEIWFDDTLIRKDGMFVLDELKSLNPENLK